MKQHFLSGYAAASSKDDMSTQCRSILGNILPEGLLNILVKYGADRFAENFIGNCDTPEGKHNRNSGKRLLLISFIGDP